MAKSIRKTSYKVSTISNEELFEMRKSDWRRCKRMIRRVPKKSKIFSIIYSIFFGAALTSSLTLVPLYNIENLHPSIIPFYIIFTFFSFGFALVTFLIDKKNSKLIGDRTKEIEEEMKEIEKLY